MNAIKEVFSGLIKSRKIVFELARRDLQARYLGSYLGFLWAFIQPVVSVLIYWFVFQIGFKSRPVGNIPFILWFVPALLSWNFFSDALANATNSITDNSYLVKKMVFPVALLPIIKIMSSLFVHLFFVVFMLGMFLLYGYGLSIYDLQTLYYLLATIVLLLGVSSITASLIVFLKDVGQFVVMILQFTFWLTPIFWVPNFLPHKFLLIAKLNPMYYIVEGYRNSFIYHRWFWQDVHITIYFWGVSLTLLVGGTLFLKKLKPHFADVL